MTAKIEPYRLSCLMRDAGIGIARCINAGWLLGCSFITPSITRVIKVLTAGMHICC